MLSILHLLLMDFEPQIADPVSQFALAVFRLHGLLMRNGEQITRSLGQSSAKWQILGRVGHKPQTVAQMAREMGLARQSVQRVADVLEQQALVTFRESPTDRRTSVVEITERGGSVLTQIYRKNHEWAQSLLARVNSQELTLAAEQLNRLALVFEDHETEQQRKNP